MSYQDFLGSKIALAQSIGFKPETEPHDSLKPHQRDLALWAVQKGRAAVFCSFGLVWGTI